MRCPICKLPVKQLKEKGKYVNTYWCLNCNKDITFFNDDSGIGHGWVAEDLHAKAQVEKLRRLIKQKGGISSDKQGE